MRKPLPIRHAGRAALVAALVVLCATPAAADRFMGRPLADVLVALSARGLRIVFSSQLVTPAMRVAAEPQMTQARALLDELLAPHGLEAQPGPGGILLVVRARTPQSVRPPRGEPRHRAIRGRVVDAASGAPLQDAFIEIVAEGLSTWSDANGRFELVARPGPHTIDVTIGGYAPAQRAVTVKNSTTLVTVEVAPAPGTYAERVTVVAPPLEHRDAGVAAEVLLDAGDLQRLSGGIVNDPMRVMQAQPRVTVADDLRSELSVRGGQYRHLGVVLEGVSTPWLKHAAHGRGDAGSLTMLTTEVLESATLQAGAHPQRHGDALGAQLEFTLREGSREERRVRATIGGIHGSLTGEGPIGRDGRGAWLATARHSFQNWPLPRRATAGSSFSFTDVLAKAVYDVTPRHHVSFTALSGQSLLEDSNETEPNALVDGTNRTSLATVGWRSTLNARTTLSHRAYAVSHHFLNRHNTGVFANRGHGAESGYRADLTRQLPRALVEAGGHVQYLHGATFVTLANPSGAEPGSYEPAVDGFASSSWIRSGYVHAAWKPMPHVTLSPGLRISESTLVKERAVSRWMLGAWSFRPGWRLDVSAGVSHQFASFEDVRVEPARDRRPERAFNVDVGIEQRLTPTVRWQATIFGREERDIMGGLDRGPWLGHALGPSLRVSTSEPSMLDGVSRGLELVVDRKDGGLSGWVAYSYGRTRYADRARGETYWAEFDQRHAFTATAVYRPSQRMSLAAMFRGGTGFSIPARLSVPDESPGASARPRGARLPPYARLDLRASRTLTYAGEPFTLFAEVVNALNRSNIGILAAGARPAGGDAGPVTRPLLLRRFSVGLQIEF